MYRGKSIDKYIKNDYYHNFERNDKYDKIEDNNVYEYARVKVKEYLDIQCSKIQEYLNVDIEKIEEMILTDAWYHIYENICLLDTYYNAHGIVEYIEKEKENNLDFDAKNAELISLKDFMEKKFDENQECKFYKNGECKFDKNQECKFYKNGECKFYKNQRRQFMYKIKNEADFIEYNSIYRVPKTCSVFYEYYSTVDELKDKRYLRTDYLDFVEYLYEANFKKKDIRSKIRRYEIWDIDKNWIPEISELYDKIQKGKNNIFEYQLAERMFKFRTALDIYNKYRVEDYGDMIYYIQPFTVFGYSLCMYFIIDNFKGLSESNIDIEVLSEFLFNAISYTIKNTLDTILNNVWNTSTNKCKCSMISEIKIKSDAKIDVLTDHINFFSKYECYDLYSSSEPDEKFMNIYIALLFNNKFINASNICEIHGMFFADDDFDCEEDESYTDGLYKESYKNCGNISRFYDSICVEGDSDNKKKFWELNNAFDKFHIYYDFAFSDILCLVTDVEYKDFYHLDN